MSIKAKSVCQALAVCLGVMLVYSVSQVMGQNCNVEPACAPVAACADQQVAPQADVAVADQACAPVVYATKAHRGHFSFFKRFFKRFEK